MNKSEKAGIICIAVGLIIGTIGFAIADFKIENLNTAEKKKYINKEYVSDISNIRGIEINTEDCEVQVVPIDGDELKIAYQDTKDEFYTIDDYETLVLKKEDSSIFSNFMVFNWMTLETNEKEIMYVYLPKNYIGNIEITSSYAPIIVKDLEQLGNLFIKNNQDDIQLSNVKANKATIETSYGKINGTNLSTKEEIKIDIEQGKLSLKHLEAEELTIDGSYSPLLVEDAKIQKTWKSTMDQEGLTGNNVKAQDIELSQSYGNLSLQHIEATNKLQIQGEQGTMNMDGVVAKNFNGKGSYADLIFKNVDVTNFELTMNQGNTSGSLMGKMDDYNFKVDVENGTKNLPDFSSGKHPKQLLLSSSYGDVNITFNN